MFGNFDQAQLQRGFQVYKEVCSNCHRLSIPFRTLADPDGPGYSEDQVKALAATYQVTNDEPERQGRDVQAPGHARRHVPAAGRLPNDQAAAAAFGKAPPDMWLLAKSRKYERGFPWFIFDIFTALSGGRRRLHLRDPERLHQAGRSAVEPLLSRPQDRDAAAAAATARSNITDGTPATLPNYAQGRRRVPELGGRADAWPSARRSASARWCS